MTKEEALKLIDQVVANFKGSRQDHAVLMEAIKYIQTLEEPKRGDAKKSKK